MKTGRDWSYAAISQGILGPPELEEAKNSPLEPWREHGPSIFPSVAMSHQVHPTHWRRLYQDLNAGGQGHWGHLRGRRQESHLPFLWLSQGTWLRLHIDHV